MKTRAADALVRVEDASVTEAEGRSVRFTLSLSEARDSPVSVHYETGDLADTATPGEDYEPVSGIATIPTGELLTEVVVPILDDASIEQNETFTLSLFGAEGADILADHDRILEISGDADTNFGTSLAIEGDTLAVGAPLWRPTPAGNPGAIHVYRLDRSGREPMVELEQTLRASVTADGGLGWSVALAADGILTSNGERLKFFARSEADGVWAAKGGFNNLRGLPSLSPNARVAAIGGTSIQTLERTSLGSWQLGQVVGFPSVPQGSEIYSVAVGNDEMFAVQYSGGIGVFNLGHFVRGDGVWEFSTLLDRGTTLAFPFHLTLAGDSLFGFDSARNRVYVFARNQDGPGAWGLSATIGDIDAPGFSEIGSTWFAARERLVLLVQRASDATHWALFKQDDGDQTMWAFLRGGSRGIAGQNASETFTLGGTSRVWTRPADNVVEIAFPMLARATIIDGERPAIACHDTRTSEPPRGEQAVARLFVTLSEPSASALNLEYRTVDGSAVAGDDYARTSGKLQFLPGELEKSVTVPIFADDNAEGEEQFYFEIFGNDLGAIGQSRYTVYIGNTAPAAPVLVLISPEATVEGNAGDLREIHIPLRLSYPAPSEVSGTYDVRAADADTLLDGDFAGPISGAFSIPAGEREGVVVLRVQGDDAEEKDETFALVLADVAGATVQGDFGETSDFRFPAESISFSARGESLAVGMPWNDTKGVDTGVVAVHLRDGKGWTETHRLYSPDPVEGETFGMLLAVDGNTLLVGAAFLDPANGRHSVIVHVFDRPSFQAPFTFTTRFRVADTDVRDARFFLEGDSAVVIGQYSVNFFERNLGGGNRWGLVKSLTFESNVRGFDAAGGTFAYSEGERPFLKIYERNLDVPTWENRANFPPSLYSSSTVDIDDDGGSLLFAGILDSHGVYTRDGRGIGSWGLSFQLPPNVAGTFVGGYLISESPFSNLTVARKRNYPELDTWGVVGSFLPENGKLFFSNNAVLISTGEIGGGASDSVIASTAVSSSSIVIRAPSCTR
ncbi:MAG: Calx-beta domain-containing protein [Verrucomicrobiales bacterium]